MADGALPTFLIVGAQKSGTTSLSEYLRAHPQVYVAAQKELHFFERESVWANGVDWYRAQFADADGKRASGEATPDYMFYPEAIERMATVVPDANLIVILRNPVDRAYSHYWHARELRWDDREFGDAVTEELAAGRDGDWRGEDPRGLFYLARGRYLPQLELIARHHGRDALLVLLFEDLRERPREAFTTVCHFIGIDDTVVPENLGVVANPYTRQRAFRVWKLIWEHRLWRFLPRRTHGLLLRTLRDEGARYEPMRPDVRARLADHYRPWNDGLAEWLGRDLGDWNAPGVSPDRPAVTR